MILALRVIGKVSKGAKIGNRYNQVPHLKGIIGKSTFPPNINALGNKFDLALK